MTHTYTYGTGAQHGLLQSITVPGSRLVTFLYTAASPTSLLNAVQDWSNGFWKLTYDANRNLASLNTVQISGFQVETGGFRAV